MRKIKVEFENELSNEIVMGVVVDGRGVTVTATGPTSEVEHTWTRQEAQMLRYLLEEVDMTY